MAIYVDPRKSLTPADTQLQDGTSVPSVVDASSRSCTDTGTQVAFPVPS